MPKQLCKYNAFLIFSFVRPFQKFNCKRSTGRSTNSSMLLSPVYQVRMRIDLFNVPRELSLKSCHLHHHQLDCCGKLLRFQQQSCFKFHSSSSSIKFEFLGGTPCQILCIWHSHMKNILFLALPTKGLGYIDNPLIVTSQPNRIIALSFFPLNWLALAQGCFVYFNFQ